MYIKTEGALVNLKDKDIVIEAEISYRVEQGDPPFVVMALGPKSGEIDGFEIQARFQLYAGQKAACEAFLHRMTDLVSDEGFPVFSAYSIGNLAENTTTADTAEPREPKGAYDYYDSETKCTNCDAPLPIGDIRCAECGHDNIPF